MNRLAVLGAVLLTTACSGVALNTRVAESPAARHAMAASVIPGVTTEKALITRWGKPVQLIRDGGQTAYVYRNMWNPKHVFPLPNYGSSVEWVIVTFQYGLAVGVQTSDEVDCRATFPPRPPNYAFDNPTEVRLVGECAPAYPPRSGAWGRFIGLEENDTTAAYGSGTGSTAGLITPDTYSPGGGKRPK